MEKKITTKESWYIFFIVMLGIAVVGLLGFIIKNPFTSNIPSSVGLTPLGKPQNILVDSSSSNSVDMFFYGSILPGESVKQDINITLKGTASDSAVRGKIFMYDGTGKQIFLNAEVANMWTKSDDGYFYCSEILTPNLTLDFVESVEIPSKNAEILSANIYTIICTVETFSPSSEVIL